MSGSLVIGFLVHLSLALCHSDVDSYFEQRRKLLKQSEEHAIGGKIQLTSKEEVVNNILMALKNKDFDVGFVDPTKFLASQHFFNAKTKIEQSKVFQFIQKVPKGTSLHSHDTALVSGDYVFNNLTFRNDLYVDETTTNQISIQFFKHNPGSPWIPIPEARMRNASFDEQLQRQISLYRNETPCVVGINAIWKQFQGLFSTVIPLLTYEPVFIDYFYQALKELYDDNIRYLEFRGQLPEVHDGNGTVYVPEEVLGMYYETSRRFMKAHPDFWGVKFILAPNRNTNDSVLDGYVDFIRSMNEKYPNFIAGFDLVGQEDPGTPLKNYIPSLLKMKQVTKLFFHAGETLWNGLNSDENLIDAVLLNTSRIGHGYALLKHPEVLQLVKKREIAIEVSSISNQVLDLLRDLRNHPANFLIANDYPVVITPDDPSFWGAKALSYDWYMAFMGMSNKHSDLKLLKQLALNSINYSSMERQVKKRVLLKWGQDWEAFLNRIINEDI